MSQCSHGTTCTLLWVGDTASHLGGGDGPTWSQLRDLGSSVSTSTIYRVCTRCMYSYIVMGGACSNELVGAAKSLCLYYFGSMLCTFVVVKQRLEALTFC